MSTSQRTQLQVRPAQLRARCLISKYRYVAAWSRNGFLKNMPHFRKRSVVCICIFRYMISSSSKRDRALWKCQCRGRLISKEDFKLSEFNSTFWEYHRDLNSWNDILIWASNPLLWLQVECVEYHYPASLDHSIRSRHRLLLYTGLGDKFMHILYIDYKSSYKALGRSNTCIAMVEQHYFFEGHSSLLTSTTFESSPMGCRNSGR